MHKNQTLYVRKFFLQISLGILLQKDLKYSKIVAEFLGTKHTQIELTEEEAGKIIMDAREPWFKKTKD